MTASEALDNYIRSLSRTEKRELSGKLITDLEVSQATIVNWRRAATPIKLLYRREISRIIGKDIFANVVD